jgi:MoaA/NifB/PqqE/SkfB family radical SAM enzyme
MANLGYIQLVRTCNQKCRFCSNPETDYVLTPEEAFRQIDDFVGRGYDGIILTGGEPTLYDALVDVIRYAHDTARMSVRMITNGQKTADHTYAAALRDAGLQHVHVSVHTNRPELQVFLTGKADSLECISRSLDHFRDLGIHVDINITMQHYNADHLDSVVGWLVSGWPGLRHFVFNHLDPSSDRVSEFPDTIPKLHELEISLFRALSFLERSGRTYRVERLPLCYMVEFAHASTETRKIVKEEERIVHFLDERGMVRQTDWIHGKTECCAICHLNPICAGLFEMDRFYDSKELYPVFISPQKAMDRIRRGDG